VAAFRMRSATSCDAFNDVHMTCITEPNLDWIYWLLGSFERMKKKCALAAISSIQSSFSLMIYSRKKINFANYQIKEETFISTKNNGR
jgi:hypothetical protein